MQYLQLRPRGDSTPNKINQMSYTRLGSKTAAYKVPYPSHIPFQKISSGKLCHFGQNVGHALSVCLEVDKHLGVCISAIWYCWMAEAIPA